MATTWIRVIYGAVLGLLLAVAVAMGVAVVQSGPTPPKPLGLTFEQLSNSNSTAAESNRITKSIDGLYDDATKYRSAYPNYQRDVFLWYAGLGILLAVIGTALPAVVNYIRLGFVTGGVLLIGAGVWFTLQAPPQQIASGSSLLTLLQAGTPTVLDTTGRFLRFAVSLIGVLVLLFIGLWRLTEWPAPNRAVVAVVPVTPATPAVPAAAPLYTVPPAAPAPNQPAGESTRWARPEDQPGMSEMPPSTTRIIAGNAPAPTAEVAASTSEPLEHAPEQPEGTLPTSS